MSDHIPFDIQSDIIKRLPVKSLLRLRSVSKQWKSFIESPSFIKNYNMSHANTQHHLLLRYKLHDDVQTYTSITGNNTFPQQKVPLTAPESLSLLRHAYILASVDGLLCFYGDVDSKTKMAVIWNPTVRKSISFVIPAIKGGRIAVGLGVCPGTNDPMLVKITPDYVSRMWVVEVFTLSTRVWKTVYMGAAPFKSHSEIRFWFQVFVNGVIYFHACINCEYFSLISFDFKSEKFGELCLPERLLHTGNLRLRKVNELLSLVEYYSHGVMLCCGVWTRKDGANNPFTKIYTVKIEVMGLHNRILEFRNNGGVVIEMEDGDNDEEHRIEVYEPSSGLLNNVGINGKRGTISVRSYVETLYLLSESDSIIH